MPDWTSASRPKMSDSLRAGRRARSLGVIAWLGLAVTACGGSSDAPGRAGNSGNGTGGSGTGTGLGSGGADNPSALPLPRGGASGGGSSSQTPPGCGDGKRSANEACDDGNRKSGDGCSADCLGIEAGYSCFPAGSACRVISHCGDGLVASSESCDDGNTKQGDGCSPACKLELGFKCDGQPSKCTDTTCGDGKQEGTEGCDDANVEPFDGCSATCQAEPNCKEGACSSKCGDGLVLNEDCDDGNTKNGDGCSSSCKIEKGFSCSADAPPCDMQNGKCVLNVAAIFRDFNESHPDFGVGCDGVTKGVVQERLSPDGVPVLANGSNVCIQSAETFSQWYRSNAVNTTIVGGLTLYDNGKGGFVNRWGPDGAQFPGPKRYTDVQYGGPGGTGCGMCAPSNGQCFDPCTPWNNNQACCGEASQTFYDGNPLFFPIDNAPNNIKDMRYRAKIPAQYGYDAWPFEDSVFPGAPVHDFHFTTQVVYWFKYDASTSAVLDFDCDDDVWVFVNGRLAVDLGAPHVPEEGSVTVSAATAGQFDLQPGNVYELRVFHAERKVEGSSFKLTLSGFDTARSDCTPKCGDGVVTAGEECDDGVNDGGYEECGKGCKLDARCGDGIVQDGEDCDDGNRRDGDECGSSCRNLELF